MKRVALIMVSILCFGYLAVAQKDIDTQMGYPQIASPNVASFNKFIDHPINIYNGNPDISIPIYTLKDGAIELPITLRYNASGIKVNEEASWVGLGWNLNLGGVISQQVIGYCDEPDVRYKDFLDIPELAEFKSAQTVDGYAYLNYTLPVHQQLEPYFYYNKRNSGKLQPDVFYFSYPGNAGKFIVNYLNDSIYILSKENDLKIEMDFSSDADTILYPTKGFVITTPEGIKHTFRRVFEIMNENLTNITFGLMKTEYPNGQRVEYGYDITDFTYSFTPTCIMRYTEKPIPYNRSDEVRSLDELTPCSASTNLGKDLVLRSIKTTNYQITTNVGSRLDVTNEKRLMGIDISYLNLNHVHPLFKQFEFNYDYFSTPYLSYMPRWLSKNFLDVYNLDEDKLTKRLKLLNVYEKVGAKVYNKYDFYYDMTNLPEKDTYAVDYWGYNNGITNNETMLPDLFRLLRGNPDYSGLLNDYQTRGNSPTSYPYKANRSYNFDCCKAGMLEGIKYPTGGYTQFNYEPNSYNRLGANKWSKGTPPLYWGPPQITVPSCHSVIDSIKYTVTDHNIAATDKVKTFTLTKAADAYLNVTFFKGQWITWHQAFWGYVCLLESQALPNGGFSIPFFKTIDEQTISYSGHLYLLPGQYTLKVEFPDFSNHYAGGYLTAEIKILGDFIDTHNGETKGCGIRIKSINTYDYKGAPTPNTCIQYDYNDPKSGETSGMLHDILNFVDVTRCFTVESRAVSGQGTGVYVGFAPDVVTIHANNTVSNPYGSSTGVGYDYVKETRIGGNNQGATIYRFNNNAGFYRYNETAVKEDVPMNGKLLEKTVLNSAGHILQTEKYNYDAKKINSYFGITMKDTYRVKGSEVFFPNEVWGRYYSYYQGPLGLNAGDRIRIYKYAIDSYNITLKSKETTKDGVTTKEDYTYNPQTLQLKTKTTTLETGNKLISTYSYPNDYNCGIFTDMQNRHMLSYLVEEKSFMNNYLIGARLNQYQYQNANTKNQIVTSSTYLSNLNAKTGNITSYSCSSGINTLIYPSSNMEVSKYDTFSNPIYFIKNKTDQSVYLWGYNGQYPIAQINNATYDQVKAALGGIPPENLSSAPTPDMTKINALRKTLPNAQISTYTYLPLVGMLTATDPSGITTYYNYDDFGRLQETYLMENSIKKVLKHYNYHYSN